MPLLQVLAFVMASNSHISVTDFGARPNSTADACAAVAKAIQSLPKDGGIIDFPKGDYHFFRENGIDRELYLSNSDVVNPRKIAILLEGKKGLKLKGNGSRLIFHDRIIPLAILDCENVSVDGFTIDWKRPLMSQGTVLSSGTQGFTLQIDRIAYPYVVEQGTLYFTDKTWKRRPWGYMEFDPATKGIAYNTGDAGFTDGDIGRAKVTEPEPGQLKFDYPCTKYPRVGDILVARHGVRDHAGTFIQGSKNVTLSHMAYRHTSGLGILSQYSTNLTFNRVEVAPSRQSERVFAGHDDGFHFSNCKGDILVDGCKFEGLMDDPINVHGTAVRIVERTAPGTLRCRFMHNQSVGLTFGVQGDSVSFLDHKTMISRGLGAIKAVKHLSLEEVSVEFESTVPTTVQVGDALENLTWTPNFTVRNTDFGTVRARGLLVSTPGKVLVEHNVFRSSGAAILIAGDANYWYESGAVTDVTIRDNKFLNCNTSPYQFGDAVISIHPEIPEPGPTPFHRGIKIESNTFETFDSPLLWAKSVSGLSFLNNRVLASDSYPPRNPDAPGLSFLQCKNVRVEGNHLDAKFRGRKVLFTGTDQATVSIKDWPPL